MRLPLFFEPTYWMSQRSLCTIRLRIFPYVDLTRESLFYLRT